MNEPIDFVLKPENNDQVKLDPAPFSVFETTPLTKVHFIFAITSWPTIFVTCDGKLKGVIGKKDIAMDLSKARMQRSVQN